MKSKDIEDIIKEKLSQTDNKSVLSDWDQFAEILKKAEGFQNLDFDEKIQKTTLRHTDKFNPHHWELLKNRLIKEEKIRKTLITCKAVEGIVLLLLIFFYQQFDIKSKDRDMDASEYALLTQKQQSKAHDSTYKHADNISSLKQKMNSLDIGDDLLAYSLSTHAYQHSPSSINGNKDQVQASPQSHLPIAMDGVTSLARKEMVSLVPNTSPKMLELPKVSHTDKIKFITNKGFDTLSTKAIAMSLSPLVVKLHPKYRGQKYISIVSNAGTDFIKSGFDKIYNIKAYNTTGEQYGIGALYSIRDNNLEFQTGIKYQHKSYSPLKISETYGNFFTNYSQISLENITFNVAELPIGFKYHFSNKGKTSYYAKLGGSANINLKNNYTINNTNAYYSKSVAISDGADLDKSTKLSKKEFTPGILQSGELLKNTFFTLNVEVGLERKLNANTALIAGIEFNKFYTVDGIGPNRDKLNGLSLNLGVKTAVN